MTLIVDRRWLDIPLSLMRWLKSYSYQVGVTVGTLLTHHQALAIIHAYPDDLTTIRVPTLALTSPMLAQPDVDFYGEQPNSGTELYSFELYGFVVGRPDDHANKTYRDRLMNDLFRLLNDVARTAGIPLISQAAPSDPAYGSLEVVVVRARTLPANTFDVAAEKYKFLIEMEIGFAP